MDNIQNLTEAELLDRLVAYTSEYTQDTKGLNGNHQLYKLHITQVLDELERRENAVKKTETTL
ncbi:hypothetical protein [Flavitalea sp.]|nr:hypothetical protein [Flavitalea sp.]